MSSIKFAIALLVLVVSVAARPQRHRPNGHHQSGFGNQGFGGAGNNKNSRRYH